jgi:hypothetical protein
MKYNRFILLLSLALCSPGTSSLLLAETSNVVAEPSAPQLIGLENTHVHNSHYDNHDSCVFHPDLPCSNSRSLPGDNNVLFALRRRHLQIDDLAALHFGFDGGLVRGMELEIGIPSDWPRGK